MTTLIILVILFAIANISLIIISIKKFNDKTDYILSAISLLTTRLDDIDREHQKILNNLNEKNTSILNKTNKIDSRFITLNEIIKDNLNNIEIAIKSLVNSINAIEEKISTVPNSEDIIDSDELVNRVTKGLSNKLIVLSEIDSVLKNLFNKINIIVAQVCSKTESIEIPDTLIDTIAEALYDKMKDLQAKNSLSTTKTKKPLLHKAKTTGKLKTATKQDNSQQERIDEIAKQQNK